MGWGRMDDHFDEHPKVIAVLDEEDPFTAAMAIATWTVCFTWAHRNTRKRGKTPGLVPAGLPKRYFGRDVRVGIELLVKHGLWDPHESGGWVFHDFEDYLPTEETREARSEAGKRGAAKRWAGHRKAGQDETGTDSNGPSGDSKLPSVSHDGDGKAVAADGNPDGNAIASDGSRAPARRAIPKGIAPTPTPTPVSPSASASAPAAEQPALDGMPEPPAPPEPEIKANDVVAAFLDAARDAGLEKPTTGTIGTVSRGAKRLLEKEKVDPARLLEAARVCGENGWQSLDSALQRLSAERVKQQQRESTSWPANTSRPANGSAVAVRGSGGLDRIRSPADRKFANAMELARQFEEAEREGS